MTEEKELRMIVALLDISFIQKIKIKCLFTKRLIDKIEYLNSHAISGRITATDKADTILIDGSIKVKPECQKIVDEIVSCLDALESLKLGSEK